MSTIQEDKVDWSFYQDYFYENPVETTIEENAKLLSLLRRYCFRDDRCLDFGCGTGEWTARLADFGGHAVGFDVSEAAIVSARTAHPDLTFLHSVDETVIPSGRFDIILVSWVIQNIESDDRLMSIVGSIFRSLSEKGRLIVVDNIYPDCRMLLRHTRFGDIFDNGQAKQPLRFFSNNSLSYILAGFPLLQIHRSLCGESFFEVYRKEND